MNEREVELLEGINVTVNLTRHELARQGSMIEQQGRRLDAVEDRQRRIDSLAPRAMRAVSESVHEHDTEMAAVAVHMGEQARLLAELRDENARHAELLKKQSDRRAITLGSVLTVLVPLLTKLVDLLMTWRPQ